MIGYGGFTLSSLLRGFMAFSSGPSSILSSSLLAHMIDGAAADFFTQKSAAITQKASDQTGKVEP